MAIQVTKKEVEGMSAMQALRKYFSDSRELSMGELKELTSEDRAELGALAKAELMAMATD